MRYKDIAPEVVRLIDEEDMQIKNIAAQMGTSESVIRRAYDHLRPNTPRKQIGSKLCRRRKPKRLPNRVFDTIQRLASTGASRKQIAKEAGCSEATVKREMDRLEKQRAADFGASSKSA